MLYRGTVRTARRMCIYIHIYTYSILYVNDIIIIVQKLQYGCTHTTVEEQHTQNNGADVDENSILLTHRIQCLLLVDWFIR
jgi:hypothetical protein